MLVVTVDKKISVNQESITSDYFIIRPRVGERKEERPTVSGLPDPKKLKKPNLTISRFKKGHSTKMKKRPNKGK